MSGAVGERRGGSGEVKLTDRCQCVSYMGSRDLVQHANARQEQRSMFGGEQVAECGCLERGISEKGVEAGEFDGLR